MTNNQDFRRRLTMAVRVVLPVVFCALTGVAELLQGNEFSGWIFVAASATMVVVSWLQQTDKMEKSELLFGGNVVFDTMMILAIAVFVDITEVSPWWSLTVLYFAADMFLPATVDAGVPLLRKYTVPDSANRLHILTAIATAVMIVIPPIVLFRSFSPFVLFVYVGAMAFPLFWLVRFVAGRDYKYASECRKLKVDGSTCVLEIGSTYFIIVRGNEDNLFIVLPCVLSMVVMLCAFVASSYSMKGLLKALWSWLKM